MYPTPSAALRADFNANEARKPALDAAEETGHSVSVTVKSSGQSAMVLGYRFSNGGQVTIDGRGGLAALADGPDNKRLASAHIARGKDILD